ncbi:hypothetical protein JWG45_02330 [Leptospira sp. 201903070]|uniref:Uncharacterized protein n=1 Tax=Leptospira ainlahdjerensis TaxID=2810033 RepID=A0ABS2U6I4_9LEPT|nr:hypothetical protein [Leptospira ainlahdjerensis]
MLDKLFPRPLKLNEQKQLDEVYEYVRQLNPGSLRIQSKTYRKRTQFQNFFGFPFSGPELLLWLQRRIQKFRIGATGRYVANFENGVVYLDSSFFSLSKIEQTVVLIHEARHGDGEFHHIDCPEGFPFLSIRSPETELDGMKACDERADGAYGFSAAFLFEIFSFGLYPQGSVSEIVGMYNSEMLRIIVQR